MSAGIAVAATCVVLTTVGIGVIFHPHSESPAAGGTANSTEAQASSTETPGNISGDTPDWLAAVCAPGTYFGGGPGGLFPDATAHGFCRGVGSSEGVWVGLFNSDYFMRSDLARTMRYYAGSMNGGIYTVFATPASPQLLAPLIQYGFSISPVQR